MKAVITDIIYPYAYTDNGQRVKVHEITGNPVSGATIQLDGNKWQVVGMDDPNCEI